MGTTRCVSWQCDSDRYRDRCERGLTWVPPGVTVIVTDIETGVREA